MENSTKQIFYLFLACMGLWIILSEFVGDKYITNTLGKLFPSLIK